MQKLMANPGAQGLKLHPFSVLTADGLKLRALIASADDSSEGIAALQRKRSELRTFYPELPETPLGTCRGTVLMLHGLNSRQEHMLWHARWLVAAGFRCVAWDSRGHGESDVATVTFGTREVDDASRVLTAVRSELRGANAAPLLAYGHSMGASVLLQWLPAEPAVRAAVAVAPFAELSAVIEDQASQKAGGLFSLLVPLVRREVESRTGRDPCSISPLRTASQIRCPVYFIHGENDALISPRQSAILCDACTSTGTCRTVTSGGHSDALTAGGPALQAGILRFLIEHAGGK
jgi:pimeloyl-ACP methyl ester carboxylesterase